MAKKAEPETDWQRMSREERMAWVEGHKGQRVRYAKHDNVVKGRAAFGPAFPIPWKTTILYGLAVDFRGRPSLSVKGPLSLLGVDTMHEPWDELWDVQSLAGEEQNIQARLAQVEAENLHLRRTVEQLEARIAQLEGKPTA